MPNHPHVLARIDEPEVTMVSFRRLLAHLARRVCPGQNLWQPRCSFEPVSGSKKLRRLVRYHALNGARAGLTADPLAWRWSTHRDVMGAVADPWVELDALAEALQWPLRGLADRLHAYISSDPCVAVAGTPSPATALPRAAPVLPLHQVARAAVLATRSDGDALQRRSRTRHLFVLLAAHQGWGDSAMLARICNVTPRSIRRLLGQPDPSLLRAGAVTLGDRRLLFPDPSPYLRIPGFDA